MADASSLSAAPGAYGGAPAARPKTSGTTSGPMVIPSIPVTTHEVRVRWAAADDHSLNRVLSYMRLNTPACEVNEWLMPLQVDKDFTVVPPLDRWGSLGVPWDHELSHDKSIILLICERQLYQDLRGYAIRAMDGLMDLRTGRSINSAGYTTRFMLALVPPADVIYRVGTLAAETQQLSEQIQELREELQTLRLQMGVRDLRIQQLRDTLGTVIETICAKDESLVGLFPGLIQQVPAGPLFDPVHGPGAV